jgi:hypothetical protein
MGNYNWFGETEKGQAERFGLQLFHFDSYKNAGDGASIIAAEMDRAEAYLSARFPTRLLQMLSQVPYELVISTGHSGASDFSTSLPALTGSLWNRAYVLDDTGCACGSVGPDSDSEVDFTWTAYDAGSLDDALTSDDQACYLRYEVDTSKLNLSSLGSLLSDYVCSILGHRLYVRGNEKWALVEKFDAEAQRKLSELADQSWLPPELRGVKFYKPMDQTFVPIKFLRG